MKEKNGEKKKTHALRADLWKRETKVGSIALRRGGKEKLLSEKL